MSALRSPRHLQGLVGDYTLHRAYYQCAGCGQGHAPLDARLGLGAGTLSPGLLRVASQAGLCHPYPERDPVHFEVCAGR